MSGIARRFETLKADGRKGLIPYIAAGHPTVEITVPLMHALARAGADVIEIGVPFSDPMADGPVIQRASECAVRNGVGLRHVLEMVTQFRLDDTRTPVVLMGYSNPIERMGVPKFCEAASAAGVDGVLVVDYPPEECAIMAGALAAVSIDPIFLIAPTTTDERMALLARFASGYMYYVSLTGVTGAAHLDTAAVAQRIPHLRRFTDLPLGVGFGIRDAASARSIGAISDAVVIGSRIIQELESVPPAQAIAAVEKLMHGFREALDGLSSGNKENSA